MVSKSLIWIALVFPIDATVVVMQGVIKGIGKQKPAIMFQFVVFLLELPMSYYFGIYCGLGLPGLFLGFVIGCTLMIVIYWRVLVHEDWQEIANRVNKSMTQSPKDPF